MLLAIDIGNTNTVLGLFNGEKLEAHFRLSTYNSRTIDETYALLFALMQAQKIKPRLIDAVAISSVVPDGTFVYQKMAEAYFKTQPLNISWKDYPKLPVTYPRPDTLGADRFCNAVAGVVKYGQPLIVIDFGTATSFDIVNGRGEFIGGVIAPGLSLAAELHTRAAKLPKISLEFPPQVIGDNTVHAIQSGTLWGTVAMLEGMVARITKEIGEQPHIIATGGMAGAITRNTEIIQHVEPYLVLEGIRIIYDYWKTENN
ncbi:MAG: type III pantothenate kinase [Candidatus Delongbacteria bacterium]|nr:type III pantothenate kinase [bacterium]MBL7033435.1 type III pantothenate kinase [Candidatus Delongbacteria bacterium]